MFRTTGAIAFVTVLSACATGNGLDERERVTELWKEHAGPSENGVVFARAVGWKQLAEDWIALRTRADDYYLIQVNAVCSQDLRFGGDIQLAIIQQTPNTLSRFDTVVTENARCRIQDIRPVDDDALRAELKAQGLDFAFIRDR